MDELRLHDTPNAPTDQTAETTAVRLSEATLDQLPEGVDRPRYDRPGLTAGIGAGMGVGDAIRQAIQQRPAEAPGGAQAVQSGMPDVMTPPEAAQVLRVSEEDVIAAIEEGGLKAKKLGKAYRISKDALEEFLNS